MKFWGTFEFLFSCVTARKNSFIFFSVHSDSRKIENRKKINYDFFFISSHRSEIHQKAYNLTAERNTKINPHRLD